MVQSDGADSAGIGDVFEAALGVAEKRVFLDSESVDENIRPAVIVVVGKVDAHAGESFAIIVVGDAQAYRFFRERAIPLVTKQLLGKRIVGDDNIRPSIAIVILKCDT